MARRTAIVTGGTGGIGRFVAHGLARDGFRVVILGRDRAKGEAVRAWIAGEVPDAETELAIVDLSSLEETLRFARRMAATNESGLSLLVLNAGTFTSRREATGEGHERVLATNHLSPFVLVRELRETLASNAPARIVVVGSSSSDHASIDPADLELRRGWNMVRAYARSKLALMMTSFDWADRLNDKGITVNVVHPGAVATSLVRTGGVIGLAWRGLGAFFLSEAEGAETPLHVCLSPEWADVTGRYVKNKRPAEPNRRALDPALRGRVWTETERLLAATRGEE